MSDEPAAGSPELAAQPDRGVAKGSAVEVLLAALRLGVSSFGGPVAHLGYYERAYVRQRRWLSDDEYANLVALCQLLPGPASSQTGFLIGLHRAGWLGALAAWVGFTLPSAVLMYAFAVLAPRLQSPVMDAFLHGLKLVAVAIVAQAVWSLAKRLCPDRRRTGIALLAAVPLLVAGGAAMQLAVLALGAVAGLLLCRDLELPAIRLPRDVGRTVAWAAFGIFAALLAGLPVLASWEPHGFAALAAVFYRAGALVFGGGHVVLPLLRDALVPTGWMSDSTFLAGYGAAQAVPGPLFTLASYLGAVCTPPGSSSVLWAVGAVLFMFLPGLLLAIAGMSLWSYVARAPGAQAALAGVNAAVVGILGAALYDPVWTAGVRTGTDVAIALTGLLLLERWRTAPIVVVAFCVGASLAAAWIAASGA
ncbi:MAG TPA: chromate efflux transporter [Thermoanaerobaculia bacterium]|nr:chromate efflux transporter [Thermoanaerobaculia bacterium]